MNTTTINNIWAQNTSNRADFNEDELGGGIEYKGPVVSNQLNGVIYRDEVFIDQLQRGFTPWNPMKTYKKGDVVTALVKRNFGQSSATGILSYYGREIRGRVLSLTVYSLVDDNTSNIIVSPSRSTDPQTVELIVDENTPMYSITDKAVGSTYSFENSIELLLNPNWALVQPHELAYYKMQMSKKFDEFSAQTESTVTSLRASIQTFESAISLSELYKRVVAAGGALQVGVGTKLQFIARSGSAVGSSAVMYFLILMKAYAFDLSSKLFKIGSTQFTLRDFMDTNVVVNPEPLYFHELWDDEVFVIPSIGYIDGGQGINLKT